MWKKLQSDQLAEFQVLGFVHLTHSAPAQQSNDAVSLGEQRARHKPSLVQRGGFRTMR
jgi:hypothetical protein